MERNEKSVAINALHERLLDIPTQFIRLSEEEFKAIHENIGVVDSADPVLKGVAQRVTEVIKEFFPEGAFIKLVDRSPKDSWIGNTQGFDCFDGDYAINLLCDSERIYEDTYFYSKPSACIALRKWTDMSSKLEFRVFIKERKLIAASQYYYRDYIEEIAGKKDFYFQEIEKKASELAEFLPLDDVIIDFFYDGEKMIVVECNPLDCFTDPCLFDWGGPIEGFRILETPLTQENNDEKYLEFLQMLEPAM